MFARLERKFGRFAIQNLMFYVIILYALGYVISITAPNFYVDWLILDIDKVLHGQVWRLVTFLIQPMGDENIFFLIISLYLYYFIGSNLERRWGSFRFNLFYIGGVIANILAVVIIYVFFLVKYGEGISFPASLNYINLSLFLAFSVEYSEVQLLLFFVIPIKVKWLGIVYGLIEVYDLFDNVRASWNLGPVFRDASFGYVVLFAMAMLNFFLFWLLTRKDRKRYQTNSFANRRRARAYQQEVERGYSYGHVVHSEEKGTAVITRHKCAICGRTELDGDDLEFRFCSKCDGNYEYCMDHLFTHTHVTKNNSEDIQ